MPKEACETLTGPVSPGSPASSKGLGLWVVRQIADELDATVSVDRSDSAGTRIELRIPREFRQGLTDAA